MNEQNDAPHPSHDIAYKFKAIEYGTGVRIVGVGTCTQCKQRVAVDGKADGPGSNSCTRAAA